MLPKLNFIQTNNNISLIFISTYMPYTIGYIKQALHFIHSHFLLLHHFLKTTCTIIATNTTNALQILLQRKISSFTVKSALHFIASQSSSYSISSFTSIDTNRINIAQCAKLRTRHPRSCLVYLPSSSVGEDLVQPVTQIHTGEKTHRKEIDHFIF